MTVNRCVCHRRSFCELAALSAHHGWTTLADLARETNVGTGCGSCRPYVNAMLITGATHFAVTKVGLPPQPCAPDPWET
ncbi:MAG: (2Fe-2S)-binding protein [Planctomycetota bacterium]